MTQPPRRKPRFPEDFDREDELQEYQLTSIERKIVMPPVHKFCLLIPEMSEDEYKGLVQSIADHGLLQPIVTFEGEIIDGRHRARACEELGIEPKFVDWAPSGSLLNFIVSANIHRRHLTLGQRALLALEILPLLEEEAAERQLRGVSDPTLPCQHGKGRGKNSAQEAAQVLQVGSSSVEYAKSLAQLSPELTEEVRRGNLELRTAYKQARLARNEAEKAEREEAQEAAPPANCTLVCGDFRVLADELEDNSVDLIVSDLPYGEAGLHLWEPLGELAARVLKPGAFLIAYSGQFFLPQIINDLSAHLSYYWTGYLRHHLKQQIFPVQIMCGGKPILFFFKPPQQKREVWLCDLVDSAEWQKDGHEWAQDLGSARTLIEAFSKPGDLILDPTMGGGTVGKAALDSKRDFIGFEIESEQFEIAKERIYRANRERTS